ncbi:MAG: RNA polymerase sigma factor [Planctomycetota bacterium]
MQNEREDDPPRTEAEFPAERRADLVRRDPGALELFFDVYFPRLWGYVRSLVRDRHLAEDLTQDIFLQLHRGFASYDPERELRPWVFAVAVNRMRDHWRSRGHRATQLETSIDGDEEARIDLEDERALGPLEPLLAEENAASIREAVDSLPDTLRETLWLRAFEDLSFEEIGAIVGRNEVAVRKRYSRALAELRRRLAGLAPLPGEDESN